MIKTKMNKYHQEKLIIFSIIVNFLHSVFSLMLAFQFHKNFLVGLKTLQINSKFESFLIIVNFYIVHTLTQYSLFLYCIYYLIQSLFFVFNFLIIYFIHLISLYYLLPLLIVISYHQFHFINC